MGEARVTRAATVGSVLGGVLGAAALALAGCADRLPVDAADRHTALPPRTAAAEAPPAPAPAALAPPAPADTCGAAELAYLVGKPRTQISIPADLTRRRVVCTTCPVTQDVRPDRQTITYDSATNLVTKVGCG